MSTHIPIFDVHVHIQPYEQVRKEVVHAFFRHHTKDIQQMLERLSHSPDALLEIMEKENVQKVALINYHAPDIIGFEESVNEYVLKYTEKYRDRMIPVVSVNPRFRPRAARILESYIQAGARMVKIHPVHQGFAPDAYRKGLPELGDIYELCQEKGIPIMIHTGTSIFPDARNEFAHPLMTDAIGNDFPHLKVILAHGGRPFWTKEAFFLFRRYPNFYFDISSIPPHYILLYFPRLAEISDKVFFGSDWPGPGVTSIRKNAQKLLSTNLPDDIKENILYKNARRFFDTESGSL